MSFKYLDLGRGTHIINSDGAIVSTNRESLVCLVEGNHRECLN